MTTTLKTKREELFEIISVYTREQAIEDGLLIDVTESAKEVGFKIPTAITSRAMIIIEDLTEKVSFQDKRGRLHDVLFMASLFARNNRGSSEGCFDVILPHWIRDNLGDKQLVSKARFKMVVGPGDNFEPVITIMMPDED